MLRRLFTLMLAVACACAPGLAASAPAKHQTDSCCCGGQCPCPPTESTAPVSSANCCAPVAPAALEQRAKGRKSAPRTMRAEPHRLIFSVFTPSTAQQARPAPTPAASVALFQAHCSLLI